MYSLQMGREGKHFALAKHFARVENAFPLINEEVRAG